MTKTDLIETINKMDTEQQNRFYNSLRENGLSEEEIQTIQAMAFFTKLYSRPELYHAVREEMGRQLYNYLTN